MADTEAGVVAVLGNVEDEGRSGYRMEGYVPRLVRRPEWATGPRHREIEGTLVFADISGFTKLSERLARSGKAGAEELVDIICGVFTPLIEDILSAGGDVLKFGGDALLFLVTGPGHASRAVAAAVAMRATLRRVGYVDTGNGAVRLRMSVGAHSGTFQCMVVGREHEELLVVGEGASTTVLMEATAEAGEILVSRATAAMLPAGRTGRAKGEGVLVVRAPIAPPPPAEPALRQNGEEFVPLALRSRLESVVAESEHRQVTVAFLHFGGVDALLDVWGVAEAHRRIDDLAGTVVEICDQLGVTVICTDVADDGAKFMLACGAPDAVDDPEARMLRACRGILDRDHGLPVRIGVNRGPVYAGAVGSKVRFTYSTMGDAVNLAARVMGKAAPGQLLATASVVERCANRFDLTPLAPFMVKGKSQPVRAFAIGRVRHQQNLLRPGGAAFIGRKRELALIAERAEAALAGHGSAVEVLGETGMGKSQLVAQAAQDWAHRRVDVVCEQYEATAPYFAARQLLRSVAGIDLAAPADEAGQRLVALVEERCPSLRPWLPLVALAADADVPATPEVDDLAPRFRRARLAEVTVELLDALVDEPLLVVVEDSFWMDDASSEVVAAIVRATASRRWLVLAASRAEATGLRAQHPPTVEVELGPLDRDDTAEVYRSTTGRVPSPHVLDELMARAAGNPLFTVELSAAIALDGVEALPASVEELVAAHLDRLDLDDRRCLRYAAVAGAKFSVSLLQRAIGDLVPSIGDPHQMKRLAEFVAPEGDRTRDCDEFVFRHDLFRRVAYEALPYARRRELHGRMGDAIVAEQGEDGEALPLLSLHFTAAQRPEEAWRYSVLAGERATQLYAPVEATRFYARALEAAPKLDLGAAEVRRVAHALGDAHRLAAQYEAAVRAYRTARRRAEDPVSTVEVMLKEGVVRERMGKYRDAVRWYLRALRALPAAETRSPRIRSLQAQLGVELAAARYRQGRLEDCISSCLAALPAAEEAQDRQALAHAYYLLDAAYTDLGRDESRRYRELALPIYRELGDLVGEADVLNNLGIDAYYEGNLDEALAYYEQCRAVRTRAGDVMGAAVAANNIGEVYSDDGRLEDAERLFLQAQQVFEGVDYPIGVALVRGNLGLLAARAGRVADAERLLLEARERFEALGATPYVAEMDDRLARVREVVVLDLVEEPAPADESVA